MECLWNEWHTIVLYDFPGMTQYSIGFLLIWLKTIMPYEHAIYFHTYKKVNDYTK